MTRVVHLIKGLGRGGAESLLPQLFRQTRGEFEYRVGYFLPWKDALVPELVGLSREVRCFRAKSAMSMFLKLPAIIRWLRREKAELLHCHLPVSGIVGRLSARAVGIPCMYTEHNVLERYHPWTRRLHLATWGLQQMVVAVSGEVERSVLQKAGSSVPVRVISNGIELEGRRAEVGAGGRLRSSMGIPPEALVVGTVAVFRRQKRFDLWLQAAARIWEMRPEARFLLVGDGPERIAAEGMVRDLGLSEVVDFPGLQVEIGPFLEAMDVYMMASEHEGLPLALLEAMAARLPVVATAVGGIPEVIAEGHHGLLVAFADVEALGKAVGRLAEDPALRQKLGSNARKRVAEEFSIERMASEVTALYRGLLGDGNRGG